MTEEHNAIKYGPTLSAAAAIAAGGGYGEVGVSRLGETLTPIINIWERPEWALLRQERPWIVNPAAGAVAADISIVGVSNPAGSNQLVVVQGAWTSDGTTRQVLVRAGANIAFDSQGNATPRDTRNPGTFPNGRIVTVSFAHNETAAQIGSLLGEYRTIANTTWIFPVPFILSPGFFFGIAQNAVNIGTNATFFGYERPALPGELGRFG